MSTSPKAHVYAAQGEPLQVLCAGIVGGPDELVWHDTLPTGKFYSPAIGEFTVTEQDLDEIVANFDQGMPFGLGAPIDEDGEHKPKADGAYGWIRSIRKGDGVLQCGIEYTPEGREKVETKALPYVSPHFTLHGAPQGKEKLYPGVQGSFLEAAALCSRPLFWRQPELTVHATQCVEVAASVSPTNQEVAMNADQARAKLEEKLGAPLSDAEWAAASAGVTDFDKLVAEYVTPAAAPETPPVETVVPPTGEDLAAENERLKAELIAEREKVAVEASQTTARLVELEKANALNARRQEIGATQFPAPGDNGHPLTPAPASVEVLASLLVEPTAAHAEALWQHLKTNGGLLLVEGGERVHVQASQNPDDIDAFLASLNNSPAVKERIRKIHAKGGVTPQEAHRQAVKV